MEETMKETPEELKKRIEKRFNFFFIALRPLSIDPIDSEALQAGVPEDLQAKPSNALQVGAKALQFKPSEVLQAEPSKEGKNNMKECAEEAWNFAFKKWIPVLLELGEKKVLIWPFSQLEDCLNLCSA
jgi:hypothetical protein